MRGPEFNPQHCKKQSIWEDVDLSYANTTPCYVRDLSNCGFGRAGVVAIFYSILYVVFSFC
jgi:hypothetical protein